MPKMIGNLALYTVEELSDVLEIQERTLREYLREGRLKGRKLARKWYISEDNIRDYFNEEEPPGSDEEEAELQPGS